MPILDGIVQIVGGSLAVVLEILATVLELIAVVVKLLVDWFKKLWENFKKTEMCENLTAAFKKVGEVIQWVVDKVKALFEWFGNLIAKAKEFLGIESEVQSTANSIPTSSSIHSSRVEHAVQSGGFGSNGFNLNTTINVNNNGRSITQSEVNKWADMMVNRVNDKLGRLL